MCAGVRLSPGAYTVTQPNVVGQAYVDVTCPPLSRGPFSLDMSGSVFTMDVRKAPNIQLVYHAGALDGVRAMHLLNVSG